MRIYHYTNIESLALILKNRTIRFSRLDKVDDLEEGNAESLGVKFCKYVFEQEMFKEYLISNLKFGNLQSQGAIMSKIPLQDMINPNFFFIPIMDYKNDLFYRHVKYVDDIHVFTKDAIQITNIQGDRGDMHMDMKPFGYYKNKRWEFQDEVRFVLYSLPINPLLEGVNPEISSIVMQSLLGNKSLPFHYYDMGLKDEIFNTLEITLSPSATESQKLIVQALIDKYAPNAILKESGLGKVVRLK